jgi:hypothetical protein
LPGHKPVERLFPFAVRARVIVPGGDSVDRLARKLEFVLIATDLAPRSREELQSKLREVPNFGGYTSAELQQFFGIPGAKVLGFKKSDIARSIRRELQESEPPPASEDGPAISGDDPNS